MPEFERKRLRHETPSWVRGGETYFITISCLPRKKNHLANQQSFQVIRDATQFYIKKQIWHIHLLLTMPDHLHALIVFESNSSMSKTIRSYKRYVAKNSEIQWQEGFFDHRIRSDAEFALKAGYIRKNPVRAGLCESEGDWSYVIG